MPCGSCGSPNPAGRKFCGECGARLALACASCGSPLEAGQKFCGECGTPTAGAAPTGPNPASAAAATVAERRLVSVLFADLVGFTPFSEERDSEEVRETLTRYFAIASDVIGAHGGTVEKFIGDAVMAVWGTPVAREDDAERAVRAALELLDAIKGLGLGIAARAGVLTGEAAVTLGATNQGMVAGDIVNTAARLQGVAAPGTVLVGEATYRAASAAIAFEDGGVHTLKGKDEPLPTWRALRIIAERGGRNRSDGLEPPFVGRDDELRMLKEAFNATAREGRSRLVSITGPAGIGKSRLAAEFGKYLDGVVDDVWWHQGRSPAYGQGITFWALGEMVRSRAGITEGVDEAATRAAVDAMLERHLPDATERAWVRPAILALLGIEGERVGPDELFARWRLLFERLSGTGTVALVFEDLHWADPATLDFIDHLLDWSKASPILVVTLARPELLDRRPEWGLGRRSFVGIALEPLPDAAMRQLLLGVAPGLPPDAVTRIVSRAEGMPLYAVETLRMLVTDRRLVLEDGVYTAVGDVSDFAVPETLTALIAARLDALDPGDRALVLDAAVLGQSFTPDGLAAVSGMARDHVEARLRSLMRRELFTLEADTRSPERGQYAFVQALIREVAYNTLARRDRKDRHLAAARYFESVGSDELAGALAGHYVSAYEHAAPGPEADALAAQARVSLRGAADRASALGSWDQAASLLEQALRVATDAADVADLHERLGIARWSAARGAEAKVAFTEAIRRYEELGDEASAARATMELGRALLDGSLHGEGREVLRAAVERYADVGAVDDMAAMRGQLARAEYFVGDVATGIAIADEVLDVAERRDLVGIVADTLISKGGMLHELGRVREGLALLRAGTTLAAEHGLVNTQLRGLHNTSVTTADVDPRMGLEAALEELRLARRIGATVWVRAAVTGITYIGLRVGEWDLAEREGLQALDEQWGGYDEVSVISNLLGIGVARGTDVRDLLERIEQLRGQMEETEFEAARADAHAAHLRCQWRFDEAAAAWMEAGEHSPRQRHLFLVEAAHASIWAGSFPAARASVDALVAIDRRLAATDALIEAFSASLAAVEGTVDRATAAQRVDAARRRLLEVHAALDAAEVAIDAAATIGVEEPLVASMLEDASAFFEARGAERMLALIEEIVGRRGARASEPARSGQQAATA